AAPRATSTPRVSDAPTRQGRYFCIGFLNMPCLSRARAFERLALATLTTSASATYGRVGVLRVRAVPRPGKSAARGINVSGMTEPGPAEQAGGVEKKRPLLRRVPSSLIVTLIGIALTAWLLPAFTRQWDDRQKARDLKASLADEMSAATATLLSTSDRLTDT